MKFNLKIPCKDCPFIKDGKMNQSLREGRLDGIKKDLREDKTFACHKTLELHSANQQHCAGALIYTEKLVEAGEISQPNQMIRIAERLGLYDYKKLDMNANIDMS